MYKQLTKITSRPDLFEHCNASALWTDKHRAQHMLAYHLNEAIDVSSRNMDFIDRSATWLGKTFDLASGKRLCDFGCGPGLYTSRLAQTGAQVTGIDFSENSIAYARQQARDQKQDIEYIHSNYLNFHSTEKFDLITLIMCDYCALNPQQRSQLLNTIVHSLKDDGHLVFDVYSLSAFAEKQETCSLEHNQLNHFWSDKEYFCFLNTYRYEAEHVMLDQYTIIDENDHFETVYNWLQYFSPENIRTELRHAGLEITDMYANVAGDTFSDTDTEFAIVARPTKKA